MAKKKRKISQSAPLKVPIMTTADEDRYRSASLPKMSLLFAGSLLFLHAFTYAFSLKGYIRWGYGTAQVTSSILNALGIENTVARNFIHLKNDTWNVTSECTAVNAVFLFISFVLAYTSSIKSKFLGIVSGIPLIVTANIFRLVLLGFVTAYWPSYAHLFHDFVWETIFIFFIIALWFAWINLVVIREKAPQFYP